APGHPPDTVGAVLDERLAVRVGRGVVHHREVRTEWYPDGAAQELDELRRAGQLHHVGLAQGARVQPGAVEPRSEGFQHSRTILPPGDASAGARSRAAALPR